MDAQGRVSPEVTNSALRLRTPCEAFIITEGE
jgi:hypothetical protein